MKISKNENKGKNYVLYYFNHKLMNIEIITFINTNKTIKS